MKKVFSVLLMLIMIFSLFIQPAFATETSFSILGSLSGYGQKWYNSGEAKTGTFVVSVSGVAWSTAQISLSLESFSSNVCVQVIVYRPNGTIALNTADYSGSHLTMTNSSNWQNLKFTNAQTGNYTVRYSIWTIDNSTPSSGRINCWIY